MEFVHLADVHLGYEQYKEKQRALDFKNSFLHAVNYAIDKKVDFILICGDLFNKKNISAETLSQVCVILRKLRRKNIPVIAIEGNHDRSHYPFRGEKSFVEYLNDEGYLILLKPDFDENGDMKFRPWDKTSRKGGYIDIENIRIYGVSYLGMNTESYVQALKDQIKPLKFTILMMHVGVEGYVFGVPGVVPYKVLATLRDKIDYLALGHGHGRYEIDNFIFNPGSLETWSSNEWDKQKGFYHVIVDDEGMRVKFMNSKRRPFFKWNLSVEGASSPEEIHKLVLNFLNNKKNELKLKERPVIELFLTGQINFESYAIDTGNIEIELQEKFNCLVGKVFNNTIPPGYNTFVSSESMSRKSIEIEAIQSLIERDPRLAKFKNLPELVVRIKNMVIQGYSATDIVDEIHRWRNKNDYN